MDQIETPTVTPEIAQKPTEIQQTLAEKLYSPTTAILMSGVLIALAIFFRPVGIALPETQAVKGSATTGALAQAVSVSLEHMKPITSDDHIRGNTSAPLIMVVYSDLECPYCKVFHQTMLQLMNQYGSQGKLAWVYRNFPIASLHSKAQNEAVASECANLLGGNDIYWKYVDDVFATTNSNNSLDPVFLPKFATELGLNTPAFNECMQSGKFTKKIADSIAEAATVGARGTPFGILINTKTGEKTAIPGAEPIEMVQQLIDSMLK